MTRLIAFLIATLSSSTAATTVGPLPLLHFRGGNLNQAAAFAASTAKQVASESAKAVDASWLSILPPAVALTTSIALKQATLALILGAWTGSIVLARGKPFVSLLRVFNTNMLRAISDKEHAGVLLFTLLLGGTIGIVQRAGGGVGLARLVSSYITSAARALYAAFALCCLIFFDDYSSILAVGSSLRPVLPQLGLPAERLAAVVHVASVVLASLSPVSSWIGLQLGYVGGVYRQLGRSTNPIVATMATLPYRFYPVLKNYLVFFLFKKLNLNN